MFIHSDLSILIVYVDDLMLCSSQATQAKHWSSLDEAVEFKEGPAPIDRFIGAHYNFDAFDPKQIDNARGVQIDMCSYVKNMSQKFEEASGLKLRNVSTPYLPDEQWGVHSDVPGRFADTCASHAATSLFCSRVGRPDVTTMTQRLCSDLTLLAYSDADWNGDPATSKSTTGFWLELASESSGHTWPISWGTLKQTTSGSATAETETVAASVRREAIPAQI